MSLFTLYRESHLRMYSILLPRINVCYDDSQSLQVKPRALLSAGAEGSPFCSPVLHCAFGYFKSCIQELLPQVASLFILSDFCLHSSTKGHHFVLLPTQKKNKLTSPRRKLEVDVYLSCYPRMLLLWVTKSKQLAGYCVSRLEKSLCVLPWVFLVAAGDRQQSLQMQQKILNSL